MPMEIDRKELKRRAKESMSLSKPSFWIVTFVYLLMTTGVSFLSDFAPGLLGGFLTIAITMYLGRVGPISLAIAFGTRRKVTNAVKNPTEQVSVG